MVEVSERKCSCEVQLRTGDPDEPWHESVFQLLEHTVGDMDFWFGVVDIPITFEELRASIEEHPYPKIKILLDDGRWGVAHVLNANGVSSIDSDVTLVSVFGLARLAGRPKE